MTTLCVFTVFDKTAGTYGRPFYSVNEGAAVRSFRMEVNSTNDMNMLFQHPDDFVLLSLGTFDDASCVFDMFDSPQVLFTARQLLKAE